MRCFFSLCTVRRVNTPLFLHTAHMTSQAVSLNHSCTSSKSKARAPAPTQQEEGTGAFASTYQPRAIRWRRRQMERMGQSDAEKSPESEHVKKRYAQGASTVLDRLLTCFILRSNMNTRHSSFGSRSFAAAFRKNKIRRSLASRHIRSSLHLLLWTRQVHTAKT